MAILTLPKESLIYMDKKKIEIDVPDKLIKKVNMKNIKNAQGVLKNKKINPLTYQRKVRDEWY